MSKWMYLEFVLPENEGKDLIKYLEKNFDLKQMDEDWCSLKRQKDNAILDIAPCKEPKDRKSDWV